MPPVDVDHLPERAMPTSRQDAIRAALLEQVSTPATRHRRSWVIGASVAGLIVAGGGAAAAYVTEQSAPETNSVYCYSMPESGASHDFPGTTVTLLGANGTDATIDDVVATCAQAWRDGVLVKGSRQVGTDIAPGRNNPVPELTACVRTDDAVAVMPGGAGLPRRRHDPLRWIQQVAQSPNRQGEAAKVGWGTPSGD